MQKKLKKYKKFVIGLALLAIFFGAGAYLLAPDPDQASPDSPASPTSLSTPVSDRAATPRQQRLCKPTSNPKNPCSPENLAPYFPDENIALQASSICNLESQGHPTRQSYVDFCRDGSSYSYGLFQINVIAKEQLVPECAGAFQYTMNEAGDDMACTKEKNGVCIVHDCRIADQTKYKACVAAITNAERNISIAAKVYAETNSWKDWGSYAFCKAKF